MKENLKKEAKQKKPYIKPKVRQVQLKPEEAVLGGCKTGSVAGPLQQYCTTTSCITNAS